VIASLAVTTHLLLGLLGHDFPGIKASFWVRPKRVYGAKAEYMIVLLPVFGSV
jgi:hypothetical protein